MRRPSTRTTPALQVFLALALWSGGREREASRRRIGRVDGRDAPTCGGYGRRPRASTLDAARLDAPAASARAGSPIRGARAARAAGGVARLDGARQSRPARSTAPARDALEAQATNRWPCAELVDTRPHRASDRGACGLRGERDRRRPADGARGSERHKRSRPPRRARSITGQRPRHGAGSVRPIRTASDAATGRQRSWLRATWLRRRACSTSGVGRPGRRRSPASTSLRRSASSTRIGRHPRDQADEGLVPDLSQLCRTFALADDDPPHVDVARSRHAEPLGCLAPTRRQTSAIGSDSSSSRRIARRSRRSYLGADAGIPTIVPARRMSTGCVPALCRLRGRARRTPCTADQRLWL